MKREKLDIVFNKKAVTAKLNQFANKSVALTKSDVARAAMNLGLEHLGIARESMTDRELNRYILDNEGSE